jgi:hypothetical protein
MGKTSDKSHFQVINPYDGKTMTMTLTSKCGQNDGLESSEEIFFAAGST